MHYDCESPFASLWLRMKTKQKTNRDRKKKKKKKKKTTQDAVERADDVLDGDDAARSGAVAPVRHAHRSVGMIVCSPLSPND
jgi:hypothetical protein